MTSQMLVQVAVKVLATQGVSAAQLQLFKQEIQRTIHAARFCPQVCRVLGFCFKEQRLCLVMLCYSSSLAALVQGSIQIRNPAIACH